MGRAHANTEYPQVHPTLLPPAVNFIRLPGGREAIRHCDRLADAGQALPDVAERLLQQPLIVSPEDVGAARVLVDQVGNQAFLVQPRGAGFLLVVQAEVPTSGLD